MVYINGSPDKGPTETIDEFETKKEARSMLKEYRLAFGPEWRLWLSPRSTKEWREPSHGLEKEEYHESTDMA